MASSECEGSAHTNAWRHRGTLFLAAAFFFLLGLWPLGEAVYDNYAYRSGVPATARIDICLNNKGNKHCEGTWHLNNESHSGDIFGSEDHPRGAQVEVRVFNGNAYTRPWDYHLLGVAGAAAGMGLFVLLMSYRYSRQRNWTSTGDGTRSAF